MGKTVAPMGKADEPSATEFEAGAPVGEADEPSATDDAVEPTAALAAMGFDDDLVQTALKKHQGDVERSGAALAALDGDWASALDDLEEMGFCDRHATSKALLLHDGSVKAAVKTLVANA